MRTRLDAPDALEMSINAVKIALKWAQHEFESGKLSPQDWEQLFGFHSKSEAEKYKPLAEIVLSSQQKYQILSKAFFPVSLNGNIDSENSKIGC